MSYVGPPAIQSLAFKCVEADVATAPTPVVIITTYTKGEKGAQTRV